MNFGAIDIYFTKDKKINKEKNPPFQWALRICSVAVSLAPPLGLEPRTL